MEQPINALNNSKTPPGPVLPRIKTYKGDIANVVKKDNVSAVKIALAENKRREHNQQVEEIVSPTSKKNLIYIITTIVLLLGGLGVVAFFFLTNNSQPGNNQAVSTSKNSDAIFSEIQKKITITGNSGSEISNIATKEKNAQIPLGTIEKLVFILQNGTTSSPIDVQDLFGIFNSRAPDVLLRSFSPNLFFGLHSYDGNNAFLIVNIESFDQAYAGMLKWEPDIQDDIGSLFGISGTKVATQAGNSPKWQDRVISNKDARVLLDQNGNILLFYSFTDNKTLVITNNQDTFKEILNRLAKPKLIH